ncbi:hypothetical protein DFH06DRAFT_1129038 [Mycena polygramma]|nr:hypothetical protein DFH06DRAFT_1129038 [Mycena polygramma]
MLSQIYVAASLALMLAGQAMAGPVQIREESVGVPPGRRSIDRRAEDVGVPPGWRSIDRRAEDVGVPPGWRSINRRDESVTPPGWVPPPPPVDVVEGRQICAKVSGQELAPECL